MRKLTVAFVSLLMAAVVAPSHADEIDKSDNVRLVKNVSYVGGTEVAFDGRYLYAGQWDGQHDRGEMPDQGGVKIFDLKGKVPNQVGFLHCPGNDNDVGIVKRGLIVLGFHRNRCFPAGSGVMTVDVTDPTKPRVLGGVTVEDGVHTMTPLPGTSFVYASPGGGWGPLSGQNVIDVSNPHKPRVVARFTGLLGGCHDWSFSTVEEDRQLGFCAGGGGTFADGEISIWDVSDPLAPRLVSQIVNPAMQFPHYALASPDGTLLAVQDENYALHECYTGKTPLGSIWLYDITNPFVPVLVGHADPPRGDDGIGTLFGWVASWCTSHHYNFVPGTKILVTGWYTAGTNLLDLSDPLNPKEIAYFNPENAIVWTAHWHKGRVYVSDFNRGLDVIEIKGVKEGR